MKKFIFLVLMTGSAISFGITKSSEESSEWRYDDYFNEMTDIKTHRAWLWAKERIPFNKDSLDAELGIMARNANDASIVLSHGYKWSVLG